MIHEHAVAEAAGHIEEWIERVSAQGDTIVLTREGRAVAEIRPLGVKSITIGDLPEIFEKLPHLSREEFEDFAADIAAARQQVNQMEIRDPWAL